MFVHGGILEIYYIATYYVVCSIVDRKLQRLNSVPLFNLVHLSMYICVLGSINRLSTDIA